MLILSNSRKYFSCRKNHIPQTNSWNQPLTPASAHSPFQVIIPIPRILPAGFPTPSPPLPSGHRNALQQPRNDLLARDTLGLGLVRQENAVAQHIHRQIPHILRCHIRPPIKESPGP